MKNVFILAYSKVNLGDDLFVDMLVNRYKNIQFYTRAIQEKTYIYNKNANLHFKDYTLDDLAQVSAKEFDAIVYIGGSIFMERAGGVERIKKLNAIAINCKKNNIPFLFINSNFGPYSSQEYKREVQKLMRNITDICFRDKNSYETFNKYQSVRYAPDVVFSYNKTFRVKKDTVGISVLNFKYRKELNFYQRKYYEVLKTSIMNYIKQGKTVTLFSFCQYEGDEDAINTLLSELPQKYLANIQVECYRGKIDEFIKKYSSMEYFLCSRFHSMVLSAVFKQKVSILSYSNKIANVINDLHLIKEYYNVSEINDIKEISLEKFEKLIIEDKITNKAETQFEAFERIMKI